eukprot:354633-Chlamydomonas_euryale.AAC.6
MLLCRYQRCSEFGGGAGRAGAPASWSSSANTSTNRCDLNALVPPPRLLVPMMPAYIVQWWPKL